MMKITYVNEGGSIYLRIPSTSERVEHYEITMIRISKETLFLPMKACYGGTPCFDYDISGKIAFDKVSGQEDLRILLFRFVFSLEKLRKSIKEYLLVPGGILLNPETIFYDPTSYEIKYCYDPEQQGSLREHLERTMDFFLKRLVLRREENVLLLYDLYQLTREDTIVLPSLAAFWRSRIGENVMTEPETGEIITEIDDYEYRHSVYAELGLVDVDSNQLSVEKVSQDSDYASGSTEKNPQPLAPEKEEKTLGIDGCYALARNNKKEKIPSGIKNYLFEIAIGILVLIGSLVILFG